MSKLLLFSLFLIAVAGSSLAATAANTPKATDNSEVITTPLMPEAPTSFDRIQLNNSADSDHVCLNIHAFIFKTDDDRIPRLVRETTCMPASGAKAEKVDGTVQPKLLPATGGNSF